MAVPSTAAVLVSIIVSPSLASAAVTKDRAKANAVVTTIGRLRPGVSSVCPPAIVIPSFFAARAHLLRDPSDRADRGVLGQEYYRLDEPGPVPAGGDVVRAYVHSIPPDPVAHAGDRVRRDDELGAGAARVLRPRLVRGCPRPRPHQSPPRGRAGPQAGWRAPRSSRAGTWSGPWEAASRGPAASAPSPSARGHCLQHPPFPTRMRDRPIGAGCRCCPGFPIQARAGRFPARVPGKSNPALAASLMDFFRLWR